LVPLLTKCSLLADSVAAGPETALRDDDAVGVMTPSAGGWRLRTCIARVAHARPESIQSILVTPARAPGYRLRALPAESAGPWAPHRRPAAAPVSHAVDQPPSLAAIGPRAISKTSDVPAASNHPSRVRES